MPEDNDLHNCDVIPFPDRGVEGCFQDMLTDLNRSEQKAIAMNGHLKALIIFSADHHWEYTTYFLEKALESLNALDNGKTEESTKWLR